MTTPKPQNPVSAADALRRLREGNERFTRNVRSIDALATNLRRESLTAGQSPFAIVLSCSDSRAPSELLFDCGLGELFVVRVAGNVVAPSIVGSVEFAAATFGTQLVVVMGHTRCGAVAATVDALTKNSAPLSDNIRDIVDRISPAVAELVKTKAQGPDTIGAAIRANIRASVNHLRHGSRVLEERVSSGQLSIVGAEYSLETGAVDFFELPKGLS